MDKKHIPYRYNGKIVKITEGFDHDDLRVLSLLQSDETDFGFDCELSIAVLERHQSTRSLEHNVKLSNIHFQDNGIYSIFDSANVVLLENIHEHELLGMVCNEHPYDGTILPYIAVRNSLYVIPIVHEIPKFQLVPHDCTVKGFQKYPEPRELRFILNDNHYLKHGDLYIDIVLRRVNTSPPEFSKN